MIRGASNIMNQDESSSAATFNDGWSVSTIGGWAGCTTADSKKIVECLMSKMCEHLLRIALLQQDWFGYGLGTVNEVQLKSMSSLEPGCWGGRSQKWNTKLLTLNIEQWAQDSLQNPKSQRVFKRKSSFYPRPFLYWGGGGWALFGQFGFIWVIWFCSGWCTPNRFRWMLKALQWRGSISRFECFELLGDGA